MERKQIVAFLAIIILAFILLTMYAQADVDAKSIVGMWLFDEGEGDIASDSSGNGNDGTLEGPKWVEGKFGEALSFDGVDDYVDTGDDPITAPGGTKILSISAWVKRATKASKMLVAIRRTPGGYILGVGVLGASTNQIKMTKFAIVDIYLGDFPQDTDWHHLVGVWHEKGQIAYIDGVVNAESTDTANFSAALAGKLLIGGDTGDQGFTDGAIDDVAVFNVALSEDDVKDIMDKGAAKEGGATSVIEKLPKGYETFLGRRFGDGVDLSGGEWQKIAISRAFMRDAQIFILDEPTAQLDALAEYEFYRSCIKLIADYTAILISHRFSTVRMADHILVLNNGKIIEEGSHQELLSHNGKYALMFNLQAERYK